MSLIRLFRTTALAACLASPDLACDYVTHDFVGGGSTDPPDCSPARPNITTLSPANHTFTDVTASGIVDGGPNFASEGA